jgi:hypothetical protein
MIFSYTSTTKYIVFSAYFVFGIVKHGMSCLGPQLHIYASNQTKIYFIFLKEKLIRG